MTPDFTLLLVGGMVFAVAVLSFVGWRFGGPDTLAFSIVSGGFTAVMDFLSAFVMRNYEYPGQSPLWVFTYIFFGWIGMCGICLFLAEGILARPDQDMLTQPRLWWQVPLANLVRSQLTLEASSPHRSFRAATAPLSINESITAAMLNGTNAPRATIPFRQ
jgi:hypothetical protein